MEKKEVRELKSPQILKSNRGTSPGAIVSVIVVVIFAYIFIQILPGLLPTLITSVHNLSDSLATTFTATGDTTLATLVGNIDTWFGYAFIGGLVILLVLLGFNMFKSRRNRGGMNYRKRRY